MSETQTTSLVMEILDRLENIEKEIQQLRTGDPFLSMQSALEYLDCGRKTFRLRCQPFLTTYRFADGGKIFFKRSEIDRLMESYSESPQILKSTSLHNGESAESSFATRELAHS